MAKGYQILPTILNVAEGSTFTLQVPVGVTYDRVDMVQGGTTFAPQHLLNLEIVIDGRVVRRYATGSDLAAENAFWGRGSVANGVLPIHFYRPEMEEVEEADLFSLGTADRKSVVIRGQISGSTAPTLAAYAAIDTMPKPLGILTKRIELPTSAGASGLFDVNSFPRSPGAAILAIHFKKSDANAVRLVANTAGSNREIVETVPKAVLHQVLTNLGFAPQTGYTHVCLIPHRQGADALDTGPLQYLQAQVTLGTAGALVTAVEYADTFQGI